MAKQQQFLDLFAKYDDDKDGFIDQPQFTQLITQLGIPYQYPGTVTKIIRKLNYRTPEKLVLNLQQAKEYYDSLESPSKHEVWKARLSLLSSAYLVKQDINISNKIEGAGPSAAPGSSANPKEEPDSKPQEGHLKILVGPPKAVYSSEIDIQFQKSQKSQKVKPFIKVQINSKSEEAAKKIETVFKESFNTLADLFAEQQPDYAEIAKSIHINSVVNNCKTTFFITTAKDDVIQLIQTLAEYYELAFNYQLVFQGNLKFEFDYDFQKFITEPGSSFYDIFAKNCQLKVNVSIFNLLKSIRKVIQIESVNKSQQPIEVGILAGLTHIEKLEGDFQFQNSQVQGETETKQELSQMLNELAIFFCELESKGIKVKQFLELLDENMLIQANGGQWKTTLFLRLKNINKIFLHHINSANQVDDD